MPLKYDQIEEVEAIVRRIVKEAIAKTAPKPETKRPEPAAKVSVSVPSDGGFLVGKQSRK